MAGIFPPCECTEGMQKLKSNGIPDRHLKAWPLRWRPFLYARRFDGYEATVTKGNKPRVHDFRHSYCVYRLNQWVRDNADLNALYPYLSEFVGHSNFADTDYYLTLAEPFYSEFEARMRIVNTSILPEVPHED